MVGVDLKAPGLCEGLGLEFFGLVDSGDSGVPDFCCVAHGVERIEKAPSRFGGGAFSVQVFGMWFVGVSGAHYSCTETERSTQRNYEFLTTSVATP